MGLPALPAIPVKPLRIFLSSTSIDLQRDRDAVASLIEHMGQFAVEMGRFPLQPNLDASGVSLLELTRSHIYLLLVAWRYGYIPSDGKLSVTHQEYREARRLGLPCFVFLADPETDADQGPTARFPASARDPSYRAQLEEFRAELQSGQVVKFFTSREDLLAKVSGALHVYLAGVNERRISYSLPASLPPEYLERTAALDRLRRALLNGQDTVAVISGMKIATLHGQGGIGKTTLARAICDDPAIRLRFDHGILWSTLGQQADILSEQRRWIGALGGQPASAISVREGTAELQRLLEHKAALLVLDDVWYSGDIEALRVGGPRCRVLITSRNSAIAAGSNVVSLDLMQRAESLLLLRRASGDRIPHEAMRVADEIAERLGDLPLAVAIVGSLLGQGIPWDDIQQALDEGDLEFAASEQGSVLSTIGASVDNLSPEDRQRYRELVIFPRHERLPEGAIVRLWSRTGSLSPSRTRRLLAHLRACALVQGDYTLHDLHYDYLRAKVSATEQKLLHALLVDTFRLSDDSPSDFAWSSLPGEDDLYAWRRLATHLKEGGREHDLRGLLLDGSYLQGKIERLGTVAALADFALLELDPLLSKIAAALRLATNVLDHNPRELSNQLFGRIGSIVEMQHFPEESRPHFELLSRSLIPPGGALVETWPGHAGALLNCALSSDEERALSAAEDGTLRYWDTRTGRVLTILEGHKGRVNTCAISPNGQQAASGGEDGILRVWDLRVGAVVHELMAHKYWILDCSYSADGRLVATASEDCTVRVWNPNTGDLVHVLEHDVSVHGCAISPDGGLVLTAAEDGIVRLWDINGADPIKICDYAGHRDWTWVRHCAISPDGKRGLSAGEDGAVCLWDLTNKVRQSGTQVRPIRRLIGHSRGVNRCAFSSDGRSAISAAQDRTLRVWDLANGTSQVLRAHTGWVNGCSLGSSGRTVLSAGDDGTMRVWNLNAEALPSDSEAQVHEGVVSGCRFTSDGRFAVTASYDTTLRLWDVETMTSRLVMEGRTKNKEGWFTACAFSPDGSYILSACRDHSLQLWDSATGNHLGIIGSHEDWIRTCAFSPDGKMAVSGGDDNNVILWTPPPGIEHSFSSARWVGNLVGHHAKWVQNCTFSPDGSSILSASDDGTLRGWDVATRVEKYVLKGNGGPVLCCAFSPQDSQLAISGSQDGVARLWDLSAQRLVRRFEGHVGEITDCQFLSNGHRLATVSTDHTLRLWDGARGQELARWTTDVSLDCVAVHPSNSVIIAGDHFGGLHFLTLREA